MKDDEFFRVARVVVTGAAGTIGRALVDKLLKFRVDDVQALDSNEGELFLYSENRRNDSLFLPLLPRGLTQSREQGLLTIGTGATAKQLDNSSTKIVSGVNITLRIAQPV